MEEEKGLFTKEQEKQLDSFIKFKNPILEAIDGPAISLLDNKGLERAISKLREEKPELWEIYVQVRDMVFTALPKSL